MLVLLLVPLGGAFAAATANQHSCCHQLAQRAMGPQKRCCYIGNGPSPLPTAMTPVRPASGDQPVAALVAQISFLDEISPEHTSPVETAPSPPVGPNCSSVLRI